MTVAPEISAYSAVAVALLLLFHIVFRTLAVKDTEVERHMRRLTNERDRAQAWERYQAGRADHWYARALGDPNPPPIPPMPSDPPPVESPHPTHVPPPD